LAALAFDDYAALQQWVTLSVIIASTLSAFAGMGVLTVASQRPKPAETEERQRR